MFLERELRLATASQLSRGVKRTKSTAPLRTQVSYIVPFFRYKFVYNLWAQLFISSTLKSKLRQRDTNH